jgi:hypothetical protein
MADYYPGEIHIGGPIPQAMPPDLMDAIVAQGLSLGGYGEAKATRESLEEAFQEGQVVDLYDEQACCGRFEALEAFLVERGIHFDRHSDARYEYDAENVYYRGAAPPLVGLATQAGDLLVRCQAVLDILDDDGCDTGSKLEAIRGLVAPPQAKPLEPIRFV